MTHKERKILEDAGLIYPSVVTNADRIRAMSDEKLAIALYAGCSGRECPDGMWDNPLIEDEEDSLCLKCTIAWLKSPVEVEE